jgi:hypothetical protein
LTNLWSYVLRDLVAIVIHSVSGEDTGLLVCGMNIGRFGRAARGSKFDIL